MPDPFITVQDLSDYLGRDLTGDPGASAAVSSACQVCRTIANQLFNAGTSTLPLDGTDSDVLILPESPVLGIGTVTVNGTEETAYTWVSDGRLFRGSAGGLPRPTWPAGRQNIVVTYEHGYQTLEVPEDVCQVALDLASRRVIQGVAQSETVGEVSVTYRNGASDLTENELRILRSHSHTQSF